MNRESSYQQLIREIVAKQGRIGVDPRHVEGWMRVEHGTLDALSRRDFEREVAISISCIDASGVGESEKLALSYAL